MYRRLIEFRSSSNRLLAQRIHFHLSISILSTVIQLVLHLQLIKPFSIVNQDERKLPQFAATLLVPPAWSWLSGACSQPAGGALPGVSADREQRDVW